MKNNDKKFSTKVGYFVLKYRWLIIFSNILILAAAFTGMANRGKTFGEHVSYMKNLRNNPLDFDPAHISPPPIFDADYHVFFDDDNPELVAYDKFQKIFTKQDNLVIVVVAKDGDIFTNNNLKSLKELTDRSWEMPYVNRVDGLTNFNYTTVDEDDLLVEDFIDELPYNIETLAKKKKLALADPLIPKFLLSKKTDITQISLQAIIPLEFPDGFMETRVAVEALKEEILKDNPNLEIRLGGTVMLNTTFVEFGQRDFKTLIPVMFIIIMVVLVFVLKSFWASILPLLLLLTSVILPIFFFVGVMKFSLTNVSMNVMVMLVAVAIADSVHVLAVFYRGLRHGMNKKEAIIHTIGKNFVACLITSITTAIGFYSLIFQNIPPFRDLGLFAGTGTLYAFLASLLTMPAILSLIPFKPKKVSNQIALHEEEIKGRWSLPLTKWIIKHQVKLRIVVLVTAITSTALIFTIKIDSTAIKYFARGTEFREASEFIDKNIIGTNPIEFNFDSGEENGVYNPVFLKRLEKFHKYIESHPEFEITHVSSIVDVVKRLNKSMNRDEPTYYKIPDKDTVTTDGHKLYARNLIAQYVLLYTLSLPQGMELTNSISIDKSQARVTVFMRSVSSWKTLEIVEDLNLWLEREMPEYHAKALGVPVMFGRLMQIAIPGMLKSLAISLIFITITLIITFKSIKIGLFSMIPNIWPILIIFGGVGAFGYTVNLSVCMVGMVTLGLAVDDTVHFLVKYLHAVRDEGHAMEEAISYSFTQVGAPLIFTSVILVAGFGSLMFSDFAMNFDMGMLCSLVIVLALFADLILLPATMLKFLKIREGVK